MPIATNFQIVYSICIFTESLPSKMASTQRGIGFPNETTTSSSSSKLRLKSSGGPEIGCLRKPFRYREVMAEVGTQTPQNKAEKILFGPVYSELMATLTILYSICECGTMRLC